MVHLYVVSCFGDKTSHKISHVRGWGNRLRIAVEEAAKLHDKGCGQRVTLTEFAEVVIQATSVPDVLRDQMGIMGKEKSQE